MSDFPAAVALRPALPRRLVVLAVAVVLALTALALPREARAAVRPRITATTTSNWAKAMFAMLNNERHANGRRPLTTNWRLHLSAHRHDTRMAAANQLSHQLPGEPFFSRRISNAGYHWIAAGENVGVTPQVSKTGLLALERMMINERPPGETGHRDNILSRTFRQVGIDVYYDAKHHLLWFTQDFGTPR